MDEIAIRQYYPILLGELDLPRVTLIGCGGTGSFLALHLSRLAYHAQARGLDIELVFVDPDVVEDKNVGRQNFCPAEIGQPKALSLATRYSAAFGLRITARCHPFNRVGYDNATTPCPSIHLLAGCVDNPAARQAIAAYLDWHNDRHSPRRVWWLDGGNDLHTGQVYLGNSPDPQPQISPLGYCTGLPHPRIQAPDLLSPLPIREAAGGEGSCADLLAADTQSLLINQAIAGWMATYVSRLLITQDLDLMATYVNLQAGSVRSVPITRPKTDEEEE